MKRMIFFIIFITTALAVLPIVAEARVTQIVITDRETPTFEGRSFGSVGQYEKLIGRAYGVVDPTDSHNSVIVDLDLAPVNDDGEVEYSTDIYIFKPLNMTQSNGKIFYDVLNRGNKSGLRRFIGTAGGNNPTTAADAGNGFFFNEGYTIVWSGWESGSVATGNNRMIAYFPVAKNPDESPVVGPHLDEFIFNASSSTTGNLSYEAASTNQAKASLSVRELEADPRIKVPKSEWSFINSKQIFINRFGPVLSSYDGGAIYEFIYNAKNPVVMGLGHASTRDLVSFLRYSNSDDNPLRGKIDWAYAFGASQSGRYLKDFIYWGFNEDESGRMVFEGAIPHISGGRGMILNDRFATPGPISWQHQNHRSRKMQFPFTYGVMHDPISDQTDGLLKRCFTSDNCPKIFHTDGGNEYWGAAASLVVTDSYGNDISLPDNVRVYFFSSTQHGPAANPSYGICQQLSNPNDYNPLLRALFVALDDWVVREIAPPPSEHPKVSNATLVSSLPQSEVGFPDIPGVTYNGLINRVERLDFSTLPPEVIPNTEYTVLVPKVDSDGNDIAGIRTPTISVPLATYMGWNLRAEGYAENEQCDLTGSYVPFFETELERVAAGDPRPSVEERYPYHGEYVSMVADSVNNLLQKRFLLVEDAQQFKDDASHSLIGK